MKNLVFIDNDDSKTAIDTVNQYVVPFLMAYAKVPKKMLVEKIEVIPRLWDKNKDEIYSLLYNKDNIILSWSAFCRGPVGDSKRQLISFLRTAGISSIRNVVYIDFTGYLQKTISSIVYHDDIPQLGAVLKAIENNYIITLTDVPDFQRIRIDFEKDEFIRYEKVNVLNLIKGV